MHLPSFLPSLTFDSLLEAVCPPAALVAPETLLTLESVETELFSFSSSRLCFDDEWPQEVLPLDDLQGMDALY